MRWMLPFVVVLCGCFALSGCSRRTREGGGSGAGAPFKVRLALNWVPEPEFGGFYEARERGLFRGRGLEVEILGGGAGVPVLQMVAAGQAEFGTVGGDELVLARARGADVVALFATFQTSPQAIMAHADRGLARLADVFRSGTVALEPGLPYAAFLRQKFGFGAVTIVPYDGGVARFLSDKSFAQQCYVTSEPLAAERQGSATKVFLVADEGYNPYGTVVITSRAFADRHGDIVQEFRSASAEGWSSYLRDPTETNRLLARLNAALDPALLAIIAERQRPLVGGGDAERTGVGAMTLERWAALIATLRSLGLLDRDLDARSVYVPYEPAAPASP